MPEAQTESTTPAAKKGGSRSRTTTRKDGVSNPTNQAGGTTKPLTIPTSQMKGETLREAIAQWDQVSDFLVTIDADPNMAYVLVQDKDPSVKVNFRGVAWHLQNHWRPVQVTKQEGQQIRLIYHPGHPEVPHGGETIVHPLQTLMHRPRFFNEREAEEQNRRNNKRPHSDRDDGPVKLSKLRDGVMVAEDKSRINAKGVESLLPSAAKSKKEIERDAEALQYVNDNHPELVEQTISRIEQAEAADDSSSSSLLS